MSYIIYHNPRCSKSRQTLSILQDSGVEPTIVEYLKVPLRQKEIQKVLSKLGSNPSDILRKKESIVKEIGLDTSDEEAILQAMVDHPILMERPIVVHGQKAVIGRPPENVKELL